jgi:hypothetical protein
VIDTLDDWVYKFILGARLYGERTLTDRREHHLFAQVFGNAMGVSEAAQPCRR